MKFLVVKIAAQQSEFPELIGDILADVGDRAIRSHDNFCVVVFAGRLGGRRHRLHIVRCASPSTRHFSPTPQDESRCAVSAARTPHPRISNAEFHSRGAIRSYSIPSRSIVSRWQRTMAGATMSCHFRRLARAFFDRFQRLAAQGEARFVFLKKMRDAGIQIPAVDNRISAPRRGRALPPEFSSRCEGRR